MTTGRTWAVQPPQPAQQSVVMRRWKGTEADVRRLFDLVFANAAIGGTCEVAAKVVIAAGQGQDHHYFHGRGERDRWIDDVVLRRAAVVGFSFEIGTANLQSALDDEEPERMRFAERGAGIASALGSSGPLRSRMATAGRFARGQRPDAAMMPIDVLAAIAVRAEVVVRVRWSTSGPGVRATIEGEQGVVDALTPRVEAALREGRRFADASGFALVGASAVVAVLLGGVPAAIWGGLGATRLWVLAGFAAVAAMLAWFGARYLLRPVEIMHPSPKSRVQQLGGVLYGCVSLGLAIAGIVLTLQAPSPGKSKASAARPSVSWSFDPTSAAWGPDRPIRSCDDAGQCPAFAHVTLNSLEHHPTLGDERFFLSGRRSDAVGPVSDPVDVGPGSVVHARVVFANDGPVSSHTRDLRLRIELPEQIAQRHRAYAWLSAANAVPTQIFDSLELRSSVPVTVSFVAGSGRVTNRAHPGGLVLADLPAEHGVSLGYRALNGAVSGCSCQNGYVTFDLRLDAAEPSATSETSR